MDLDHFKDYNDCFGHLEGDKVLAACAQALKDQVRSTDLTCRYGGEEFVALLPHTSLSEALVVAERVRAAVEGLEFRPVLPDGRAEKAGVSVCVGAAAYNREMGAHGLVRRADQAMYLAKSRGRNRVAAYRGEGRIEVLEPADPIG
jgi:diguanylate cyclase (GGDEF)-like protein